MIPSYAQPFLWSYDVNKLDLQRDKRRIITNILNLGTAESTDWLFKTYHKEDIKKAIIDPLPGEWDEKSLNFWSLILNIKPGSIKRNVL